MLRRDPDSEETQIVWKGCLEEAEWPLDSAEEGRPFQGRGRWEEGQRVALATGALPGKDAHWAPASLRHSLTFGFIKYVLVKGNITHY